MFYLALYSLLQYFANQLLPLKDEQIVAKLMSNLSRCIKEFEEAVVLNQTVVRLPRSATHFFPGSIQTINYRKLIYSI